MLKLSTGHVFMSYSRRDDAVMRRIVIFLRNQGIKVWVDNEKLIPGTPIWEEEIEKAIKNAPAIVVVLSPDSKNSEWVRREISLADQYRKRVFPVLVRGDEEASLSLRLIGRQFVDIRKDEEAGLNSVSTSLLLYLKELDAQEQKTKKEANRLAAQKTRNEKKLANQQTEEERIAHEENAGQVSDLTDENEKGFVQQKAGENADGVYNPTNVDTQKESQTKSLTLQTDPEKEELSRKNSEIYNRSREASYKATKEFLPKLKIPALVLIIAFIGYLLWQGIPTVTPATSSATKTKTPLAAFTPIPPTETIVPTPTVGLGSTMLGKDDATLVYVPKGEFTMGSDADDALAECQKYGTGCQRDWFTNEEPPHSVLLDAFWIDKTEVTNAMYAKCVKEGSCKKPANTSSETHPSYYGNSEFDNYPVIYVDWSMSNTYCSWAGRRLPTEAEWEKAARGTKASTYPWGNTLDGTALNFCDVNCAYDWANKSFNDSFADVSPVGNYPSGQSVYGALDLAGNVWEWVNDWYDVYPGSELSISSEFKQKYRVLRGGSWYYSDVNARSAYRLSNSPDNTFNNVGFRCAQSP